MLRMLVVTLTLVLSSARTQPRTPSPTPRPRPRLAPLRARSGAVRGGGAKVLSLFSRVLLAALLLPRPPSSRSAAVLRVRAAPRRPSPRGSSWGLARGLRGPSGLCQAPRGGPQPPRRVASPRLPNIAVLEGRHRLLRSCALQARRSSQFGAERPACWSRLPPPRTLPRVHATPLLVASFQGHLDVVKALLDAGAAIDQTTDAGDTPLSMASQGGHLDVVRALRKETKVKENWALPAATLAVSLLSTGAVPGIPPGSPFVRALFIALALAYEFERGGPFKGR